MSLLLANQGPAGSAVGYSAGTSKVQAVGQMIATATGSSVGTSTVQATGQWICQAVGSSVGISDALGIGQAIVQAVGSSSGSSVASAVGEDSSGGTPISETLVVLADGSIALKVSGKTHILIDAVGNCPVTVHGKTVQRISRGLALIK